MSTPTTPTVMPLEQAMPWLLKLREHFAGRVAHQLSCASAALEDKDRKWWTEQARLEKSNVLDPLDAALHHLEAGKRETQIWWERCQHEIARVKELAQAHDDLVERSVGAMAIAEGEEGHEVIPRDCPMLVAVSNLRRDYDLIKGYPRPTISEALTQTQEKGQG